jgi:hypothetical protein
LKFSCYMFFTQFLMAIPLIGVYVHCSLNQTQTWEFTSFLRRITIKGYIEAKNFSEDSNYFWLIFIVYAISVSLSQM